MISSRRLQLQSTWNACDGLGCQARIADPYIARTASTRPTQCLDKSCFEKRCPNVTFSFRGGDMDCGIFGTTFFFDALVAHGQEALGIDVLTNTGYPGLGYMIANDATTLWEAWEGDAHHIGGGGSSHNHIMQVTANCIIIEHFSAFESGLVAPFLYAA